MSEMTVGNTVFTVISVQSDHARETAYQKLRRLILENAVPPQGFSDSSQAS